MSGSVKEAKREIENSPLLHSVETVETVETPDKESVTKSTQVEPAQVEPNVEPNVEPTVEPNVEPTVEPTVEPAQVERPRVSLKQKLRKNILFRFHSPVCSTPSLLHSALRL